MKINSMDSFIVFYFLYFQPLMVKKQEDGKESRKKERKDKEAAQAA
jgi:hypothetical protein